MANIIEKIHNFTLQPESLASDIVNFMKFKPVHIEYSCKWQKDEQVYYPTEVELIKVWRELHIDDSKNNEKNSWFANELPEYIKQYFSAGLKIHAESFPPFT